ncbi:MAG TPA: response regulator [Rhodopirellula baltica]|uniref:Probable response regulator n=1 Tax=Rhodopirellula baltica (strain DSM 10527 / NCIMB 13988 / SH1) TaxID=243090 RepID=Q7UVL6_RHOBA|nr:response regulator [Rhodopirellula baltica]CAD72706.1 probable response regulator [Rhodopirellula baltica SH 1]HBE61167.1 response regulator [Rhodopirellula baltica]
MKPSPVDSSNQDDVKRPTFLLIEDDAVDAEAFRRAVKRNQVDCELVHASDGGEALEKLRSMVNENDDIGVLAFLDLNMPGLNGHEFLAEVRRDESLKRLAVFVVTTSRHKRDIALAYDKNVAGYFEKDDLASVLEIARQFAGRLVFPTLGGKND